MHCWSCDFGEVGHLCEECSDARDRGDWLPETWAAWRSDLRELADENRRENETFRRISCGDLLSEIANS